MTLVRWTPFRELRDMPREMSRVFGRPFASLFEEPAISFDTMPPLDVLAKGDNMVIRMEIPGIEVEDLDISLGEGAINIAGERREEKEVKEGDYYRRERSYGHFERSLPVPEGITEEDISATYEDGILEITIKGAAETTPVKRIEVKAKKGSQKEVETKGEGSE